MIFEIFNLQRRVKIKVDEFRSFAELVISDVPETDGRRFSIAFISDKRMKQLNHFFRGKDSTTDVLSFPWSEPPASAGGQSDCDSTNSPPADAGGSDGFLGDIAISVEQAQKQAAENGLSLEGEIKQLILHGLLHLCGYDHETDKGEMNARELELREQLGI